MEKTQKNKKEKVIWKDTIEKLQEEIHFNIGKYRYIVKQYHHFTPMIK